MRRRDKKEGRRVDPKYAYSLDGGWRMGGFEWNDGEMEWEGEYLYDSFGIYDLKEGELIYCKSKAM